MTTACKATGNAGTGHISASALTPDTDVWIFGKIFLCSKFSFGGRLKTAFDAFQFFVPSPLLPFSAPQFQRHMSLEEKKKK